MVCARANVRVQETCVLGPLTIALLEPCSLLLLIRSRPHTPGSSVTPHCPPRASTQLGRTPRSRPRQRKGPETVRGRIPLLHWEHRRAAPTAGVPESRLLLVSQLGSPTLLQLATRLATLNQTPLVANPPIHSQIRVAQGNNRKSARPPVHQAELLIHSRSLHTKSFRPPASSFSQPQNPPSRSGEHRGPTRLSVAFAFSRQFPFPRFLGCTLGSAHRRTPPGHRLLSPLGAPTVISLRHLSRPAQLFYWSAPTPLELAFFHQHSTTLTSNFPIPNHLHRRRHQPSAHLPIPLRLTERTRSRDGYRPVERRVARGDAGTHPAGTSRG